MQNVGDNMNQGALSPTSSSVSGSSVRSTNEFSQQQLKSKLISENASMDYIMRNLELKMQGKQEELKNLLEEKSSTMSSLENLKKQLTLLKDRESSLAQAISRIRDNNTVSERLESAVIQNLKAIQISNEEQKSKWGTMIKNYTTIMNSHQEIYSSLPWVKEKKKLTVQLEKKRIFLERMKLQEEDNRAKKSFFDKISGDRMKIEIVRLSKLMVDRNSELNKSYELESHIKTLVQEIETMEREKKKIEDDILLRTHEMMRRIVDRSNVKENTSPSETTKKMKVPPAISSIRDRLGISKKEECKRMLAAASLRDRLCFPSQRLSPVIMSGVSKQREAPSLSDSCAVVCSPPAQEELPDSPHMVDAPSSLAEADEDPPEIPTEAATETAMVPGFSELHSESELTPEVPAAPPTGRISPHTTISLPASSLSSPHSRPVPLKAILKPPASLGAKNPAVSSQTVLPSFALGRSRSSELSSAPTLITHTSQPQGDTAESSSDLSCSIEPVGHGIQPPFKRSIEVPHLPETEGPVEPKKSKVEAAMPPPLKAVTRRPPRPKSAAASSGTHPPKTPKRVSFVTDDSQTHAAGSSQNGNQGAAAPSELAHGTITAPSQTDVHPETASGQHQVTTVQPIAAATESIVQPEQTSPAADQQPSPSGTDDFPPPFSSPPQPLTGPGAPQGAPGNFDSIFGAIFNSPQTPNDSMGFQFPIGRDPQKHDTNQGQSQASAPPTGQDFFSFFGTPNTDSGKKSSSDNFFKLF